MRDASANSPALRSMVGRVRRGLIAIVGLVALALPAGAAAQTAEPLAAQAQPPLAAPVAAGDWPDPDVSLIDGTYYAVATAGGWSPTFQILQSTDLRTWTIGGSVFRRPPGWAKDSFWAPELAPLPRGGYASSTARCRSGRGASSASLALLPRRRDRAVAARPVARPRQAAALHADRDDRPDPRRRRRQALPRLQGGRQRLQAARRRSSCRSCARRPPPARPAARAAAQPAADLGAQRDRGAVLRPPPRRLDDVLLGGALLLADCAYAVGVARAPALAGPWTRYPGNPILRSGNGWRCPATSRSSATTSPSTPTAPAPASSPAARCRSLR